MTPTPDTITTTLCGYRCEYTSGAEWRCKALGLVPMPWPALQDAVRIEAPKRTPA